MFEQDLIGSPMKNRLLNYRIAVVFVVCLTSFSMTAEAQRGRFNRQPGQQDVAGFLGRLDSNRNGFIEPNEMSSRTRSFISELGFDPDSINRISTIVQKIENDKEVEAQKRNEQEQKKQLESYRKVPDFSTPPKETLGVPGFDGDISTMSDEELIKKFGSSAVNQGIGTMTKYDRNKDGAIDEDEQKGAPWGNPSPQESDKNKDGRLSKYEIILRYYEREQAARQSGGQQQSQGWVLNGQPGNVVINGQPGNVVINGQPGNPNNSADNPGNPYRRNGYVPPNQRRSTGGRRYPTGGDPGSTISRTVSSPVNTTTTSSTDRLQRYAQNLVRQYDKNKDGKLDKGELGAMRRPPVGADANQDGYVTIDEYVESLSKQSSSRSSSTSSPPEPGNPKIVNIENAAPPDPGAQGQSRSPRRPSSTAAPASFDGLDTNKDGQVQMSEFSGDWDEAKVEEFEAKDVNGDGLITPEEWSGQSGQ